MKKKNKIQENIFDLRCRTNMNSVYHASISSQFSPFALPFLFSNAFNKLLKEFEPFEEIDEINITYKLTNKRKEV